jgi:membrane protease YdiL (CAAX protease family)
LLPGGLGGKEMLGLADERSDGGRRAVELRGFGPAGLAAALLVLLPGNIGDPRILLVPVSGILVLAWARLSRTPLAELGFGRPRSWSLTIAGGVALGAGLKVVMKAVVLPLMGADPVNHAYHFAAHNPAVLPGMAASLILAAGFGEEATFRGFLFERIGKLIGTAPWARLLAVLVTTALFAWAHYPGQGMAGVQQAVFTGLAFALLYLATGSLWLSMVTHAAFDLTALAIIYFDVERAVAGWLFG